MLPESLRTRMIRNKPIERDGRTMSPAMQIILYILEKRRITTDIENIGVKKIRDFYDTTAVLLQKRPPRIKTVDHMIDLDDDQIMIREYIPKDFKANDHSMLFFHGGGFSIGSIKTHDPVCKFLSKMLGWKIFSVEYRLAPEHRFPTPLEDCDQAMDWLIKNADEFEIDMNKIAIGGDSAGGNLAACLCIKRIEEGKIEPERQILFYPAVDTGGDYESIKTFTDGYFLLTKELLEWFGNNYIDESEKNISKNRELGKNIVLRILAMLVNEAADAYYLNIASKKDIDLAMTKGVNYPKGLLKWADEIGVDTIFKILETLYNKYCEDRYRPSPILRKMTKENIKFY